MFQGGYTFVVKKKLFLFHTGVTSRTGVRPYKQMELYTDQYYVKRIQEGDVSCFACLLNKYSHQVHTLIRRVVTRREDAEELTQDVFLKVYRSISSFKGDCSFSTWIYRIAYNTAISETRKRKIEYLAMDDTLFEQVSEEEVAGRMNESTREEQLEYLERAIECLLPEERALILLYYREQKTIEEIVVITELTTSNVKTKLFRIRKKLFVLFKQMEEKDEK